MTQPSDWLLFLDLERVLNLSMFDSECVDACEEEFGLGQDFLDCVAERCTSHDVIELFAAYGFDPLGPGEPSRPHSTYNPGVDEFLRRGLGEVRRLRGAGDPFAAIDLVDVLLRYRTSDQQGDRTSVDCAELCAVGLLRSVAGQEAQCDDPVRAYLCWVLLDLVEDDGFQVTFTRAALAAVAAGLVSDGDELGAFLDMIQRHPELAEEARLLLAPQYWHDDIGPSGRLFDEP